MKKKLKGTGSLKAKEVNSGGQGAVQVVGEKIYRNLVEAAVYIHLDFIYSRSFQENTLVTMDFDKQLSLLNFGLNKFVKRYTGDTNQTGTKFKFLDGIKTEDCLIKYNYVHNEISFTGMQRKKMLVSSGSTFEEYTAVNLPIQMWRSRKAQQVGKKQTVTNWGETTAYDQTAEYFQTWNFEKYNSERNDPGNMHSMVVGDKMTYNNHEFDDVWYGPSSVYFGKMTDFLAGKKIIETAGEEEATIFPVLPYTSGVGNGNYERFFYENSNPNDASGLAVVPFLDAADPATMGTYAYQQISTPHFTPNEMWNVAVVPSIEAGGSQTQGQLYYDISSKVSITLCIPKKNKRKYGTAEFYDTDLRGKMIFKHPWMSRTIKGDGIVDQTQLEKYKDKATTLAENLSINTQFSEIYNGTETF